jgi:thioredoxin-like negative regulator of GroEL
MIARLIFVVLLAVLGYGLYRRMQTSQVRKARHATQELAKIEVTADTTQATDDPLVGQLSDGVPVLVYFTTPTCTPCKLHQTPTLQSMALRWGDSLKIIRIDATEHPDIASQWGVFSVPTTFVLDGYGEARFVHNGVVSAEVLTRELGFSELAS